VAGCLVSAQGTRGQVRGARLLVGVYVDDFIITGNDVNEIPKFKLQMQASFRMNDVGLLSFCLGIGVQQGSTGISLSQTVYARSIVDKAGMASCNSCATPMETQCKMSNQSAAPTTQATEYRSLIRSLSYLIHTWPDIAFTVGYVSRFLEKPQLSTLLWLSAFCATSPGRSTTAARNDKHDTLAFSVWAHGVDDPHKRDASPQLALRVLSEP
jgi:hypothetical protein